MGKIKEKDFKTIKKRVGKEQLRKFNSLDEKLLSNLSRVKKTVKLSTQSISIKKDSLNITSRRLTFPELIGKSRHTSENVRNHALIGLSEFIRRYEEEGRPNVYILLQVSCSSLFSNSNQLRLSSRNLLLSILSTYFKDSTGCSKKCSEVVHLYLIQGILIANGTTEVSFSDDVYTLVNLVLDKHPWILSEYYENLLKSLIKNPPESLSFKHFNCIYSLFKLNTNIDHNTRNDLMEYIINVLYKLLTNRNPIVNIESNSKINKRTSDKGTSIKINNEIECLSRSSMVVKSFKILYSVSDSISVNDSRVVDLLLSVDLFESENITDKGKETFEKLFLEFVMIKAQISLKLLPVFSRYHLGLLVPLLQLESLKKQVEPNKLVQILLTAISLKFNHGVNVQVKLEWADKILNILSDSKLNEITVFKSYLQNLKNTKNQFNLFNRFEEISEKNKNKIEKENKEETKENKEEDEIENCTKKEKENGDLNDKLFELYNSILNSLFNSVLESPSVWPLLALLRGVPPQLFPEIFSKSHYWSYLTKPKSGLYNISNTKDNSNNNTNQYNKDNNKTNIEKENQNNSILVDGVFNLGFEFESNWELVYDFEQIMSRFIDIVNTSNQGLLDIFLNLCLYVSKKNNKCEFYYKLTGIGGLKQEHWLMLSRIFLNIPSSKKINDYLTQIVLDLFSKGQLVAVKEFMSVLVYHVLNFKSSGRLDEQGRVIINFDVTREVLDHVEYFLKFYLDLVKLAYRFEFNKNNNEDNKDNKTEGREENKEKETETVEQENNREDNNKTEQNKDTEKEKETENNREEDVLLNYTLKLLIDKYLMAMCNIESDGDLNGIMKYFIEESLHPQYETISVVNRSKPFKVLKEVLVEYIDKESIPDWISIECK